MVTTTAEEYILDCYRLARWYHQSPVHFLEMPLSELRLHMVRTIQVQQISEQASSDD